MSPQTDSNPSQFFSLFQMISMYIICNKEKIGNIFSCVKAYVLTLDGRECYKCMLALLPKMNKYEFQKTDWHKIQRLGVVVIKLKVRLCINC